ncbi:MAG: alpha/beta hydrolase [Lysobacter sp.]
MIAMGYLGLCAWMYSKQREFTYFPQFTRVDSRETDYELRREGATLRGWLVNPGRPNAILYFGGNAERVEMSRDEFAALFPDSSVYLLAYRGYGASDGSPNEADLFADALALFDHVRARHSGSIAVIGRSLGSGIASYLASQRPVEGLVLITPFDSLADVASAHYPWLPVRSLFRERYESTRHLADYRGPILVIRAGRDEVIPAANTNRLIAALATPPRIVDLPGADHNSISDDPAYGKALTAFVNAQQSP